PGEVDDWTFYARAGQTYRFTLATGNQGSPAPLPPSIDRALISLVNADGKILASASNDTAGADVVRLAESLTADGIYHVLVQSALSQAQNTGHYVLTGQESIVRTRQLSLNTPVAGQIDAPGDVDRWTFSAVAGQQVRFHLVNSSSTGIRFDL